MKEVFIIIPAYNESGMLPAVVAELRQAADYSIVVVDDGSDTQLCGGLSSLEVYCLRHTVNLGQGAAIQTGIDFALSRKARYLVTFDADGQHHVADIPCLLQPLGSGEADIVFGSRFMDGNSQVPVVRRFVIQLARWVNFLLSGLFMTDAHNGLRAMNAHAAQRIRLTENRMAHATEILVETRLAGLRWKEVPVTVRYTDYSMRKGQRSLNSVRILFDLILYKLFK